MKSRERTAQKGENLGEKLKRVGKGKRGGGGQITPVAAAQPFSSSFSVQFQKQEQEQDIIITTKETPFLNHHSHSYVSVRKLAATLWEQLHYYKNLNLNLILNTMHNNNNPSVSFPPPRLRRNRHHHHQQQHIYQDKSGLELIDPCPISPNLPGSSSSLRRLVTASLRQHHRTIERTTNHAIATQPLSPASYGSSMEVQTIAISLCFSYLGSFTGEPSIYMQIAPYNPAVAPTSSIELKGRNGEASYSLRTSTELLKILNRIWSLEEQHVSNVTLVRALKRELDHARSRIKELVREQHTDRHGMDELMKQITEDKLLRKNKDQDRINALIQSMRDELEDERKLRKRSESIHRKLAKELHDAKQTLATVSKEFEKERKTNNLLEQLCDEFAWGIRDYEKELHSSVREISGNHNNHDKLILHVSESWLDERMQMKLESTGNNGVAEKGLVVDRLRSEIEAFLQTKRNGGNQGQIRDPTLRRSSLESIPMNTAISAPLREEDEYDSAGSDSNCFELEKMLGNEYPKNHFDELVKQKQVKKKPGSSELSPSSLQVKFETQMVQASCEDPLVETKKPEKCESSEKKHESSEGNTGSKTNGMIENLIKNHYLLSESEKMQSGNKDYGVSSSSSNAMWRSHPSPIRHWTDKLPSHNVNISNSTDQLKESSVKGKLLFGGRATKGQQRSRTRTKASSMAPS